jgi:glucosamine 6-phosphate synthetase-like amidotransferase/phosphosugar isomerase protein
MCGVIGLVYERSPGQLGLVAADLLRALEYRGYDSTGAAVQDANGAVRLVKGIGAPSVLVHKLGITQMQGTILCGQVRWATFGAVDDRNAQPHEVRCRAHLYGAHNGNVTNCDDLKAHLLAEGHHVVSDNDGEMVVHTIEHRFARELERLQPDQRADPTSRRECLRRAVVAAAQTLEGSYAAVVVDPATETLIAIKQGSSLYFGVGNDPVGGRLAIASSDLSCVLKLTRAVVPLHEGEMVEFTADGYSVWAVHQRARAGEHGEITVEPGDRLERAPVRSRLRAKDTALQPPFRTFMDQEISAQEAACRDVIRLFTGGSEAVGVLAAALRSTGHPSAAPLTARIEPLRDIVDDEQLRAAFYDLVEDPDISELVAAVSETTAAAGVDAPPEQLADRLLSSDAGLITDLLHMARSPRDLLVARLLDAAIELEEVTELQEAISRCARTCANALANGGRLYAVSCGSSYHAAKAAAVMFNEICGTSLLPILPGQYHGQYARALCDDDVLIAVSQSGETKDLIDVIDDVAVSAARVHVIALVNNLSSTLAQEKSDLVVPLRCGPEIAVPATKSFMNQMVVLHCLAMALAEQLGVDEGLLARRIEKLRTLPRLIRETFDATDTAVLQAATLLAMEPSIHILATRMSAIAEEGALKIREVVLNHTQGFEGSEFKHGPNTILGFDTVFGPNEVEVLLARLGVSLSALVERAEASELDRSSLARLVRAACDSVFAPSSEDLALTDPERAAFTSTVDRQELLDALRADYPLIYITGPDERDVALTISQINTHKIRGAMTVVIAEDHPALRQAATKAPADNPSYESVYIALPRTNDRIATLFSATVVLQRLALKMSEHKARVLDRLGIADHGVHPDVPKNVSKSITVD